MTTSQITLSEVYWYGYQEKLIYKKGGQALEQAAHRSSWFTIPEYLKDQ